MKLLAIELSVTISKYEEKLKNINETDFAFKLAPGKWSKKEELGHVIDSAHNNLRRLIVAQYEHNPKIIYHQDDWVKSSNYQQQQASELILLWTLLNKQICGVLKAMPEAVGERKCDTGHDLQELHSLQWLANDYIRHLKHHLHHILELEPAPYR